MDNPSTAFQDFFVREGRLHPAWRAILYIVVYLFCLFFIQIPLILAWLTILLRSGNTLEAALTHLETDMLSLTWMLPLAVFQTGSIVGVTYVFRRLLDRRSFAGLGFRTLPGWAGEIVLGLLLGFGVMGGIFLVEWITGWATIAFATTSFYQLAGSLIGYALVYMSAGIAEELIFRGYLLQTLQEWPGTLAATVITSVLFGLGHACNPNVSPLALFFLIVAGFIFAYAYLATGRLWLPIALHFSWNFFQGPVFGFPVSGVPPQGIFSVQPTGPALLTGGSFGPEAGFMGLAALAIITVTIRLWSRTTTKQAMRYATPAH